MTEAPTTQPALIDADSLEPVGLFGAATVGGFQPVPVVSIDGVDVASGAAPDGTVAGLVVVDGLEVTWGRDEVLDHPDPPTGRLELFDPSGTWATSSDLRGKTVTLAWDDPASGVRTVFFRARVGDPIVVRRKTIVTAAGIRVTGAIVALPLVSNLVDLANIRPAIAYPEEQMLERRPRLAALAAGVVDSITLRASREVPNIVAYAVKDQPTVLEQLQDLYRSCGADRMAYQPSSNTMTYVQRRDYWTSRGHGILWRDAATEATARAGKGVYVRATGNTAVYPVGLDAAGLEYDPADGITQPAKITRVEVSHPMPAGAPDRLISISVTGTNETRDGVRTLRSDVILTNSSYADTCATDLEDLVRKEGGTWRLEPITWSSRRNGGFESAEHARFLLNGGELQDLMFLQRSWLPAFGLRPVFGVMGQTITYRDQSWDLSINLSPITTTLPQHAITWEEIDDGSPEFEVQWWDEDHPNGMHESLTFEDLGYVARGLGVTTIGPDQGFDRP